MLEKKTAFEEKNQYIKLIFISIFTGPKTSFGKSYVKSYL